jgi:surfactin synthase thioesterase subunit
MLIVLVLQPAAFVGPLGRGLHSLYAAGVPAAIEPLYEVPVAFFRRNLRVAVPFEGAIRLSATVLFSSECEPPHTHEGRTKSVGEDESILDKLKHIGTEPLRARESRISISMSVATRPPGNRGRPSIPITEETGSDRRACPRRLTD